MYFPSAHRLFWNSQFFLFDLLHLWKTIFNFCHFQPKPAQRGSGQISLKDLGNLEEITKKLEVDIEKSAPTSNSDKDSSNKDGADKSW